MKHRKYQDIVVKLKEKMRQDSPFFMMIKCYTDADHYEKRRIFYG